MTILANTLNELPTYIKKGDFESQETYFELMSLILVTWFNANGFYQANLSTSDVINVLAQDILPAPGTHWFNTTLDLMQYLNNNGIVESIVAYPASTIVNTTFVTGSLTPTQVNGMYAAPISLIAAPGANQIILVNNFMIELVYGSAAFTSGGNTYLQYGTTAHGSNFATPGTNIPATFLTGTANAVIQTPGTINTTSGLATSIAANAPISITNDTGAFTTGTGCSLNYYIWYSIISIT